MTKTKLSSTNQLPISSSTSSAEEFLKTEYELLNQWAVHGENVTHQIFNFYVTILAAILGGLVVLVQTSFVSTQESLLIVSGTCGFLVIMGSVFFDALVSQYIRNMHNYFSMKAIRTYFQKYQEVNSSLLKTPIRFEDKESLSRRLTLVKFGFPGGNQLTLIEIMNSLLVGIAICSFIWGVAGLGYRFVPTIIVSIICWLTSEVVHRTLVNIMMKRNMEEMASSLPVQEIYKSKDN